MNGNVFRWNKRNLIVGRGALLAVAVAVLWMLSAIPGVAYETYTSGCDSCHGSFTGSTSPQGTVFPSGNKHTMHRSSSYMNTECELCHTEEEDDPFLGSSAGTVNTTGFGCSGCHDGAGLRAHHALNSVSCYGSGCHSAATPQDENVKPPYYGSVDTNVDNPCNDVLAANVNENWSVGDFLGLDNDGDNLYDLADYSCGPLRMVDVAPEGNDLRVRWETAGGRHEWIQTTSVLTNGFSDVGSSVAILEVGIVTQEVVLVNGAADSEGFFKVRSDP